MNWARWGLQAGVSFAILGMLFWWLPTDQILTGITKVPLALFLGVVLLFLFAHLFSALKWWILIGRTIPAAVAVRAHYIGLTATLCLPGVAGGDAARIAVAWKHTADRSRLAAGALSDRLIDLMALTCIALIGLILAEGADPGVALKVLPVALAVFVAGLWVGPRIAARLWMAIPKLPARNFVLKACDATREITANPLFLLGVLGFSIAIQGALILIALQLARAIGVDVTFATWAFAWALAKLIVVLPVSLGGLGVREAVLAALLAPYGAAGADVVASGLAWQGVLFVSGTVGAILLATSARGAASKVIGSKEKQGT